VVKELAAAEADRASINPAFGFIEVLVVLQIGISHEGARLAGDWYPDAFYLVATVVAHGVNRRMDRRDDRRDADAEKAVAGRTRSATPTLPRSVRAFRWRLMSSTVIAVMKPPTWPEAELTAARKPMSLVVLSAVQLMSDQVRPGTPPVRRWRLVDRLGEGARMRP
jgi:hypothetical protein